MATPPSKQERADRAAQRKAGIREKELRALEMRLAGVSTPEIAKVLGYNHRSSVSKAIKRLMNERMQEGVDELRQMECERLDKMLTALWPQAMQGKWLAIDRVLRVQERKAALMGLDAPQRRIIEVITPDVLQEALQKRQEEVKELEAAEQDRPTVDFELDDEDAEDISEAVVVHAKPEEISVAGSA